MTRTPRWLRARTHKRLLIHTNHGTYDGTALSTDRHGVELVNTTFRPEHGDPVQMAGHAWIPREQIRSAQAVPHAHSNT